MKRRTTDEERLLFKQHIDEARPLKAAAPKPKKPGRALPPSRAQSALEGEQQPPANGGALAARRREPERQNEMRRPEGPHKPEGGTKNLDGHTAEKLRRGQLAPGARIDLHGMTEAAAHGALLSFLTGAQARGVKLVLVITGIGNPKKHEAAEWMRSPHGVLKEMVPRWLNERAFAALSVGSSPAHRRHGGDGALYVYLRKKK